MRWSVLMAKLRFRQIRQLADMIMGFIDYPLCRVMAENLLFNGQDL
ncbi:hypothetical protein KCP69_04195 [Salmonella enterica subsp. enterica]|nr:hypothetical protein KCP69_04195 [Salmonella enterica subsp. enterica]